MKDLSFFERTFLKFDRNRPMSLIHFKENDYCYEIAIANMIPPGSNSEDNTSRNSKTELSKFFGNRTTVVKPLSGDEIGTLIQVSRVDKPRLLKFEESIEMLQETPKESWFLGLTDFGPHYFSTESLTHIGITGATGYGKSSFFKFLLSQTLKNEENTVNFIVDPKKIDFNIYESHPRVMKIARTRDEWCSLYFSLITEMAVRQHVFSTAFKVPPTSLEEYRKLKKEYKRNELPHFPKIMLWIDEAKMAGGDENSSTEGHFLSFLARKSRSFGIHIIYSSQRYADVNYVLRTQASHQLSFFQSGGTSTIGHYDIPSDSFKSIPGLLIYKCPLSQRVISAQVPKAENGILTGIAFDSTTSNSYENFGLYKLNLPNEALKEFKLAHSIMGGYGLDNFDPERKYSNYIASADKSLRFVFEEFYDIEQVKNKVEVDKEDIEKIKRRRRRLEEVTRGDKEPSNLLEEFEKLLG